MKLGIAPILHGSHRHRDLSLLALSLCGLGCPYHPTQVGNDAASSSTSSTGSTGGEHESSSDAESSSSGPPTGGATESASSEESTTAGPLANGEACSANDECASGRCCVTAELDAICGDCDLDAYCSAGGCS